MNDEQDRLPTLLALGETDEEGDDATGGAS
jgi:hypothetical protein